MKLVNGIGKCRYILAQLPNIKFQAHVFSSSGVASHVATGRRTKIFSGLGNAKRRTTRSDEFTGLRVILFEICGLI